MFKNFRISAFLSSIKDGSGFQIIYKDRTTAAKILAASLKETLKYDLKANLPSATAKEEERPLTVLGIPRGGAIIADIVANKLRADFDIVMSKRLLAPYSRRSMGAIMEDGSEYLDDFVIDSLRITRELIEKEKFMQQREIDRMKSKYRPGNKPYRIKDRIAILVDDGADRGSTLIAAARWIRKMQPRYLIIAVPVANPDSIDRLRQEADKVEIVTTPVVFSTVDQFYKHFKSVKDEEILSIMERRGITKENNHHHDDPRYFSNQVEANKETSSSVLGSSNR